MQNKLILILNCGSSSLKFAIINPVNGKKYVSGLAERLDLLEPCITWKINNITQKTNLKTKSKHKETLQFLTKNILIEKPELITQLIGIGHRVVHGGKNFTKSMIINDNVLKGIIDAIPFAPLHNPAHIIGIQESFKEFPQLIKKNVAVFDTAFHQTIPEIAYLYAIPYFLYKNHNIRRYGAHGISHFYVSHEAAKILNKPINMLNLITCHLGNGSSIAAIKNGKCIDTSMGLTPLEGLVMGTRSGDIDPAIVTYLYKNMNMSIEQINTMLTKESGLLGLTDGMTSDCRDIENQYYKTKKAARAIDIFCYRLIKYIGAYSILMENNLDALIFTGGIGENATLIRYLTLKKLKTLGIKIDQEKNIIARKGRTEKITTNTSRYPVLVIPTNEELIIAQDTLQLIT